ncbi:uncharacterized protein LOC121727100 [Aricia agestis]|uniref:uncharacterized protein LOC121727100 n=1 Tax=Aricia agestis TaxID=91739 RepID=UPI001C2028CC|nr:uncharacterized protein LOC121727100 [Aricia agestis]
MEDAFNKLKKEGKNNVDALVKLMQDNKLVEGTKASEERARKLFEDVKNQANVDYKTFQEALAKLAADQAKSAENLAQNLSAEGSKFMQATSAAAKAAAETFKDAMKK